MIAWKIAFIMQRKKMELICHAVKSLMHYGGLNGAGFLSFVRFLVIFYILATERHASYTT